MTTAASLQNRGFLFIKKEINNIKANDGGNSNSTPINAKEAYDKVILSTGGQSGFDKYVEEMEAGKNDVIGAFFNALGGAIDDIVNVISSNENNNIEVDYNAEIKKIDEKIAKLEEERAKLEEEQRKAINEGNYDKANQLGTKASQIFDEILTLSDEKTILQLDKTAKDYPETADMVKEAKNLIKERIELRKQSPKDGDSYDKHEEYANKYNNLGEKIADIQISIGQTVENARWEKLNKEIEEAQKSGDTQKAQKLIERKQKIQTIDSQLASLEQKLYVLNTTMNSTLVALVDAANGSETSEERSKIEEKIEYLQNHWLQEQNHIDKQMAQLSEKRVALFNGEDVEVEGFSQTTGTTSSTDSSSVGGYVGISVGQNFAGTIQSSISMVQQKLMKLSMQKLDLAQQSSDVTEEFNQKIADANGDAELIKQAKDNYNKEIKYIERKEKELDRQIAKTQKQLANLLQQKADIEFDAKVEKMMQEKSQAEQAGDKEKAEKITAEIRATLEDKLAEIEKQRAELAKEAEAAADAYAKARNNSGAENDSKEYAKIKEEYDETMRELKNKEKTLDYKYQTVQLSLSQLN